MSGESNTGATRSFRGAGISVIVVARNEAANLLRTVTGLLETLPRDSEIVIVDDDAPNGDAPDGGARDVDARDADPRDAGTGLLHGLKGNLRVLKGARLGVTKARNLGAENAAGEVLIFADAHIDVPAGWWAPLVELLEEPAVGAAAPAITVMGSPEIKGYGLTLQGQDLSTRWLRRAAGSRQEAAILPGCCVAMRRETFRRTGGFDAGMSEWGMSDVELSIRMWLLGLELWVTPDVEVAHLFRREHPYPVAWSSVLHNKLRTALVHFNPRRTRLVMDALKGHGEFSAGMMLALESGWKARREGLAGLRVRDDDWFFERFAPEFDGRRD